MTDKLTRKQIQECMRKTSQYGCEDVVANDFVSLMDIYEDNYIKMRKLVPNLQSIVSSSVSTSPGHLDLHLKILERSRYTTTLLLSYCFSHDEGDRMEPNLKVRIYHDAELAEVMSGKLHHGRLVLDNLPADARQQKWQLNRFLARWLHYCLRQKHGFKHHRETMQSTSKACRAGQI